MVFLILAAIVGSAIGFVVLLPFGMLAAFAGVSAGGALAVLLAGLCIASMRRKTGAIKSFTVETDSADGATAKARHHTNVL